MGKVIEGNFGGDFKKKPNLAEQAAEFNQLHPDYNASNLPNLFIILEKKKILDSYKSEGKQYKEGIYKDYLKNFLDQNLESLIQQAKDLSIEDLDKRPAYFQALIDAIKQKDELISFILSKKD